MALEGGLQKLSVQFTFYFGRVYFHINKLPKVSQVSAGPKTVDGFSKFAIRFSSIVLGFIFFSANLINFCENLYTEL